MLRGQGASLAARWPLSLRLKSWAVSFGWFPGWLHVRWNEQVCGRIMADIFGAGAAQ